MLHFLEPFRMLLLQPVTGYPAGNHCLNSSGIANCAQIQVDKEKSEDNEKSQRMQCIRPAKQLHTERKVRGKPHEKPGDQHEHAKEGDGKEKHLLAGIVFTSFGYFIHMPQISARCLKPIEIFRENKNSSFSPPHLDRQKKCNSENNSGNVMPCFQIMQSAHNIAEKVQFFIHHPHS